MAAAEKRNQLANERTEMSEDRTIMSNERTFAGWSRTGMAAMGIALGFNALFGRLEPSWIPKVIASGFLVIAITIFISAYLRASALFKRLDTHSVNRISHRTLIIVTCGMVAGASTLIVCVWMLDWTQ